MRRLSSLAALLLLLVGCGDAEQQAEVDAGLTSANQNQADKAQAKPDVERLPAGDLGLPASEDDGGAPSLPDGMPSLPDGLPPLPDGGVPPLPDGLPPLPDGLPPLPDGGVPPPPA